jgi:putative aminopeptidase FrvX
MSPSHEESSISRLYQAAEPVFQVELIELILKTLAGAYAPSQTVAYTRAKAIQTLMAQLGWQNYQLEPDYARTGNVLLSLSSEEPRLLFLAHADEISYLVGPQLGESTWSLLPYCNDTTQIDYPAVALRYQSTTHQLEAVAHGLIQRVLERHPNGPYFRSSQELIQPGDRLVYYHPLVLEGDFVKGSLDNAAGVAACLVAIAAFHQVGVQLPLAFAFTDEEEGPAVMNSSFARGARRLMRRMPMPELCVVVDGCEVSPWCTMGQGAYFSEKSSLTRGAVVPPHLYTRLEALTFTMQAHKIGINPNLGYLSRSDDVACMEVTPNILFLSYPIKNPHFNQAAPTASLSDLLNLAKAIFWTGLAMSTV